MNDKLKIAFSNYVQKVKSVIGNKKTQFEKRKAKDILSIAYINPQYWLIDRITELEKSHEFNELVSKTNGKHIKELWVSPEEGIQNFFRRSGCYLKIWEKDSINIDDYFNQLWDSCNEKNITTTNFHLLDLVSFPTNNIDFGSFKIQRFASSTMKCNTWESRKENAILSGYGKLQTFIIVRTRLNNGHALGKEVVW